MWREVAWERKGVCRCGSGGARKRKEGEKGEIKDKPGLDVVQSYPQCRTCFKQYQASSAAQGRLGNEDWYIMQEMQSGTGHCSGVRAARRAESIYHMYI